MDIEALVRKFSTVVEKVSGIKAQQAGVEAIRTSVETITKAHNTLAEIGPIAQAHCGNLTESAKKILDASKQLEGQASKVHEMAAVFFENMGEADWAIRWREWCIAGAIAAALFSVLSWNIRSLIQPVPPMPDIVQLVRSHGGQFQFTQKADGSLVLFQAGGTRTTPAQGWEETVFPSTTTNDK
jgi:hypothetical protein